MNRLTSRRRRWLILQALNKRMLKHQMLKSTAISDAGITKQTLYEIEKSQFTRSTYERAVESLNAVKNGEITALIHAAWDEDELLSAVQTTRKLISFREMNTKSGDGNG